MTLPNDTIRALLTLCQHLEWFPQLTSNRVTEIMRRTSSRWSPQLQHEAASELLALMRDTFFPVLSDLGGRIAFPSAESGEAVGVNTVLFRWFAPERTVTLFSELHPESAAGSVVARSLCLLAEHQLHSLRLHSLRGRNLERWTSEDTGFLENVSMLPQFYHQFGVFGWASYFEQVALAHRDGYLEEFVVLSPFGNRAWVSPKPYEWAMIPPDALLALLLEIANTVEVVLTSALCRSESPSPIRRMILDITSSVIVSAPPECFASLMRSFSEQQGAGRKRAQQAIDAYERIRRVYLIAVGNLSGMESTQ